MLSDGGIAACVAAAGLTAKMLFTPAADDMAPCRGGSCGVHYCGGACETAAWRGWHAAVHVCAGDSGGGGESVGLGGGGGGGESVNPGGGGGAESVNSGNAPTLWWDDEARGAPGALHAAYAALLAHCRASEEHAHLGALRIMLACAVRGRDVCPGLVSDDSSEHVRKHIDEVKASRP
jgi:hypothetical protein